MGFNFDFDKFYDKVRMHIMAERNVMDKGLLRYLFIESHPKYREINGMPYIDVLYKRTDTKGNSLTPIIINDKKPSLTVLNDSDFSKANLYYGKLEQDNNKDLDAVFSFVLHKNKLFTKRNSAAYGKDAGEFFYELNKLAVLGNKERYFVYVFDLPMKAYYGELLGAYPSSAFLKIAEGIPKEKVEVDCKDFDAWAQRYHTAGQSQFLQKAFSIFYRSEFSRLDYKVETLYSNTLIDGKGEKYYLVIGRVK